MMKNKYLFGVYLLMVKLKKLSDESFC